MEPKQVSIDFHGRKLELETGKLAVLATGAVLIKYGDTQVLCTATIADARPGLDFFPLTCEFLEKFYASGKMKGSRFIKREGKASDQAVLVSRLMDRPLRPMFPKGMTNEVQIIATMLSADLESKPDVLAMVGSSAALTISGIPFDGPVGAVRIGMIDGEFIVNPTYAQTEVTDLDLVIAGTIDAVTMVEAGAKEVDNETMIKAIELGHQEIKKLCELQLELKKLVNPEEVEPALVPEYPELEDKVKAIISDADLETLMGQDKIGFKKAMKVLNHKVEEALVDEVEIEETEWSLKDAYEVVHGLAKKYIRKQVLTQDRRIDGRSLNGVRPLSSEVGIIPRTHGSGLFQRGPTQVLSLTTLGGPGDAQILDGMDEDTKLRYIHHYNFPPYSTGETKPLRHPSRREIGHGALAERALIPVLPDEAVFPYTIRVVSEVLTCDGSSSMASVCGSTLSLMDAGVPIKKPVSGIAMGLISDEESGTYKILSDIQAQEDFLGDMDFKCTGTKDGITALQMDIKINGLDVELLKKALDQAYEGRMLILESMLQAIPEPRGELSKYAPMILSMRIDPEDIAMVIGKGGETIKEITEKCNVEINIEQDGSVSITALNQEDGQKAQAWISGIVAKPEVGKEYDGVVTKIMEFGAFVQFMPGKEGLVHISQISDQRVNNVADVLKEGQKVKVKLMKVDEKGRNNLTMKGISQQ